MLREDIRRETSSSLSGNLPIAAETLTIRPLDFGRASTPTLGNFAGHRGCRLAFRVIIGLSEFVLHLLQEPILAFPPSHFGFQDRPVSSKFRAIQDESHHALDRKSVV